ncbi:hypothetical protein, partial [Segatella buccae]|uniref:hypothetical protein n=1 Tax=Segatella buccae TaxID=28126 RepID=UPI00065F856C
VYVGVSWLIEPPKLGGWGSEPAGLDCFKSFDLSFSFIPLDTGIASCFYFIKDAFNIKRLIVKALNDVFRHIYRS